MSKDVATLELDYSEIAKRINIALSTLGKLTLWTNW